MTIRNQVQNSGNPGRICSILLVLGLVAFCATRARAQKRPAPSRRPPLVLTGIMYLPHVEGRLDHMDYDSEGNRLFVSALGSDREEVIDLSAERVVQTLSVPRPQGVAFVPGLNKIFVGSDEGKLNIFDGATYKLITTIDLGDDADDLRYDAAAKQVYVGYGDGDAGAIGVVDAATDKLVRSYKVGDHPESFQLETSGPEMYVNVPGRKEILAINRKTGKVVRWLLTGIGGNFPMALDEADHRLFVITHRPDSRLAVFDTNSGHLITTMPCVVNSDDLYYDAGFKRIYATGGEGFISVYQQESPDRYRLLAKVPSDIGARTSQYPGRIGMKAFNRFFVGVPEGVQHGAQVWMYSVQK
jgi:DNA-binding beta-propeller fold protein YncE